MSRRYIGLDTWDELLKTFAQKTGKSYDYFRSKADGDLPKTARLIASAFHSIWHSNEYDVLRKSLKVQPNSTDDCLKYAIAHYLSSKTFSSGSNPSLDQEVEILKKAKIDGIITTNWDLFLESLFSQYRPFVGQEEILFAAPQGIAEIYKIHGCISKPESLVLTNRDYRTYHKRNPYLVAKLLAIFLEHPVIFLGYSLTDKNIQLLLSQIVDCLSSNNIQKLQNRLLFVQRDKEGKGDRVESSIFKFDDQNIPVTVVYTNDFSTVYQPLSQLPRRYSAPVLRRLKEHIYELVKTNDPKEKLRVMGIEDANTTNLEIVFGVGVYSALGQKGYAAIDSRDLLIDVLDAKSQFDEKQILKETLPSLLLRSKNLPVFRYLRNGGFIETDGSIRVKELNDRVAVEAVKDQSKFYTKHTIKQQAEVQKAGSVEKVIDTFKGHAEYLIPLLKRDQVECVALEKFIRSLITQDTIPTHVRRLIGFYDWVAFR